MKIGPRPEVSVIIPTYNRAWSLPATVDSVLGQTFQDFELIVVDDGSTDGTESLVREMPGAVYLPLRENAGVSAARNRGMERARGRFICFLDSDDRWLPGKLEAQWHWMVGHPDVAACYTDEIWIRGGVR
ncbi:MAG: glycosyltransferase family 2 protein, partial [Nitrospinaceae bacterium]